jgi:UDP-3-O-[3-hydroxymyristoyl] glucosamine N-acyltransferase
MISSRYYVKNPAARVADLAQASGAELIQGNGETLVSRIGAASDLERGVLVFIRNKRSIPDHLPDGGIIVVDEATAKHLIGHPVILLQHAYPQICFGEMARQLTSFRQTQNTDVQISPKANISKTAILGFNAVIEDDVVIGENTKIGHNVTIGVGCRIGDNCDIGSGAQISFTEMGDNVCVLPCAVIGSQGLGVAKGENGLVDIPHFGQVIVKNGVTIGANAAVDRGVFGPTTIGQGSKIDNLVQIAHNVQVGSDCIFAAQVGVSGSVVVGDRVLMGGRVGIIDHITIGDDAVLTVGSAVMRDIPAGETWGGIPAQPIRSYFREVAWLRSKAKESRTKKRND